MTTERNLRATKRAPDAGDKAHIKQTRIVLVDDHPVVRRGLVSLIESENGMSVVAEVGDARTTMAAIKEHDPDLVLVDLTLPDIGGIELTKQIKAMREDLPVLILSMHDETVYAERALKAGAQGYVMKDQLTERLIDAIRTAIRGEISLSEQMSSVLLGKMVGGKKQEHGTAIDLLSDRELEVFELLGRGLTTREVADRLCLSVKTIETHREHIKEKLNISDATKLIQRATHWVMTESMEVPA